MAASSPCTGHLYCWLALFLFHSLPLPSGLSSANPGGLLRSLPCPNAWLIVAITCCVPSSYVQQFVLWSKAALRTWESLRVTVLCSFDFSVVANIRDLGSYQLYLRWEKVFSLLPVHSLQKIQRGVYPAFSTWSLFKGCLIFDRNLVSYSFVTKINIQIFKKFIIYVRVFF